MDAMQNYVPIGPALATPWPDLSESPYTQEQIQQSYDRNFARLQDVPDFKDRPGPGEVVGAYPGEADPGGHVRHSFMPVVDYVRQMAQAHGEGDIAKYYPAFSLADMEPGFGEYFAAQASETLENSPTSAFFRSTELTAAQYGVGRYGRIPGGQIGEIYRAPVLDVSGKDAQAEANAAGLHVDFGDGMYSRQAVDLMLQRAHDRADRGETIVNRRPSGATHLGVSLVASLADPLNIAAGFVPVIGEARYAELLAGASGFAGRTAIRAGVGFAEGAAGAAAVEPVIERARSQEGQDFEWSNSLANIAFGGVFGTALHTTGGAFREIFRRTDYSTAPVTPLDAVDRISPEVKSASLSHAIADLKDGRPVTAADTVDAAMARDPELHALASYEATLRRNGPEIDNTPDRITFWEGRLRGAKAPPEAKGQDFISWVRSLGGVRDTGGELAAAGIARGDLPPSVYVSPKGAARTARGVELDRLYDMAVAEGFVSNRAQFLDAFRAGKRDTPLRPIRRQSAEDAIRNHEDEQRFIREALAAGGTSPKAPFAIRARAIVNVEQDLVAAERQRLQGAQGRLETRVQSMRPAKSVTEPLGPRETATELAEQLDREETAEPPLQAQAKPQEGEQPAERVSPAVRKLQAQAESRRAAVEGLLDPESRAALDDALGKLGKEEDELTRVYDAALSCLIGGSKS